MLSNFLGRTPKNWKAALCLQSGPVRGMTLFSRYVPFGEDTVTMVTARESTVSILSP